MNNRIRIIFIILIMIMPLKASSQDSQSDRRDNIAVIPFEKSSKVSEDEIIIVAEAIRHELIVSEKFNVLGRDKMGAILEEQKLQLSGICDELCLVEIGRILAVEKLIGGSLRKISNLYIISAQIYDVESGQIIKSVLENFKGDIEQLLTTTIKKVANDLTGGKGGVRSSADLFVNSDPIGASIILDGKPLNNVTPFVMESLLPGEHNLILFQGNLRGERSFRIEEGEFKELFLPLANMEYKVRFRSPIGANFEIIGYESGQVPKEIAIIPKEDSLSVLLHMPYHESKKISINLTNQTLIVVDKKLKPAGSLIIKDGPGRKKSEVYLDNELVGLTPYESFSTPFGFHSVKVAGQFGEEDYVQGIELSDQARDIEIIPEFKKKNGRLKISVNPIFADVTLDGNKLDLIKSKFEPLEWGRHKIEARMTGYKSESREVLIDNSEIQDININLEPLSKKRAIIYSALFPGLGDIYLGERKKGVLTTLIGVSFLTSALIIRSDYNDLRDQYNIDRLAYENATSGVDISSAFESMKLSFDKADNKKQLYDGLAVATALFWLYNVWDVSRYRSPTFTRDGILNMKNSSKSIYWDNHTNSLGLNILF